MTGISNVLEAVGQLPFAYLMVLVALCAMGLAAYAIHAVAAAAKRKEPE
jgi:hypothetical protein